MRRATKARGSASKRLGEGEQQTQCIVGEYKAESKSRTADIVEAYVVAGEIQFAQVRQLRGPTKNQRLAVGKIPRETITLLQPAQESRSKSI